MSGAGRDEVTSVKTELSDIYPYLQWLVPYIVERKTKTNYQITLSDDDTDQETSEDTSIGEKSDKCAEEGFSEASSKPTTWKFHKAQTKEKKKRACSKDCEDAELELIQTIGKTIANKSMDVTDKPKDDNDLFGELIAAQLKQLPPEKNIMVKMQISNLIYEQMMNSVHNVHTFGMSATSQPAYFPPTHGLI